MWQLKADDHWEAEFIARESQKETPGSVGPSVSLPVGSRHAASLIFN